MDIDSHVHLYSMKEKLSTSGFEAWKLCSLCFQGRNSTEAQWPTLLKSVCNSHWEMLVCSILLKNGSQTFKASKYLWKMCLCMEEKWRHYLQKCKNVPLSTKSYTCLKETQRAVILNWCTRYSKTAANRARTVYNYQRHPQLRNINSETWRNPWRCQVWKKPRTSTSMPYDTKTPWWQLVWQFSPAHLFYLTSEIAYYLELFCPNLKLGVTLYELCLIIER